jgi:hypothetical protein
MGVLPQLEERERVVAVSADELRRGTASLGARQLAGRAERAEEQVGEDGDAGGTDGGDHDRSPRELIAELEVRGAPGEQAGRAGNEHSERKEERGRRAERRMADVERVPPPPEEGRRRPAQQCLLEVEALQQ